MTIKPINDKIVPSLSKTKEDDMSKFSLARRHLYKVTLEIKALGSPQIEVTEFVAIYNQSEDELRKPNKLDDIAAFDQSGEYRSTKDEKPTYSIISIEYMGTVRVEEHGSTPDLC